LVQILRPTFNEDDEPKKIKAGKGKMETELTYLVLFVAFMLGLLWVSRPKKRPQRPHYHYSHR